MPVGFDIMIIFFISFLGYKFFVTRMRPSCMFQSDSSQMGSSELFPYIIANTFGYNMRLKASLCISCLMETSKVISRTAENGKRRCKKIERSP